MIARSLDIGLVLNDNGKCEFCVTEPESGYSECHDFYYDPTEHLEFNELIGNAIYSWIEDWMEATKEED